MPEVANRELLTGSITAELKPLGWIPGVPQHRGEQSRTSDKERRSVLRGLRVVCALQERQEDYV
jgi:hypothetical protein